MKKHFNGPTNKGSTAASRKEYGRRIVTSQASIIRYAGKTGLSEKLAKKTPL
jgi:hypothetical protein